MSSNISKIEINKIEKCTDNNKCNEIICLLAKNRDEPDYHYQYKIAAKIFNFKYIAFNSEKLNINFDPNSNILKLNGELISTNN